MNRKYLNTLLVTAIAAQPARDTVVAAIIALPPDAPATQITPILTSAGVAAPDASALATQITLQRDALEGVVREDTANPVLRNSDAARFLINDPADPFLTTTAANTRFVTTQQAQVFGQRTRSARNIGIGAALLALAVGLFAWFNHDDANERLDAHDTKLATLASADTATLAALQKLTADTAGLVTQVVDHETRLGAAEGNITALTGRVDGHDGAIASLRSQIGVAKGNAYCALVASGASEAAALKSTKLKKAPSTCPAKPSVAGPAPSAPAPASTGGRAPASAASLTVVGDRVEFATAR